MTQVWIGETTEAAEGDYVLTPAGDTVEVARVDNGELCPLPPMPASALPDLDSAGQERLLDAIRGVETAVRNRGG